MRTLSLSLLSFALFACGGASSSTPPASSEGGAAVVIAGSPPTSDALVAAIRAAKIPPGSSCGGMQQASLGEEYVAQAKSMQELATSVKVPFVEGGECKPASQEDTSRLAATVPGAAWYCVVHASPDWSKAPAPKEGEEEGGTNFAMGFALDNRGILLPDSLHCVAAG